MTRDEALAAYQEAMEVSLAAQVARKVADKACQEADAAVDAAWEVYLTTINMKKDDK